MAFADEATAKAYREAWDAWVKQIEHLHRVFLDGEPIRPDQIKGLLNREARAKEKYDAARLRLLGLDESPLAPANRSDNRFK
ncbi:MAG: hypothetical protein AMXMBFR80_25840 [Dehalococcoidia bacterium]